MRACPACGTTNADPYRFCRSCGAELEEKADGPAPAESPEPRLEARPCPECGTRNPIGYGSCAGCGESLAVTPSRPATGGDDATVVVGDRPARPRVTLVRVIDEGAEHTSYPVGGDETVVGRDEGDLCFPSDVFLSSPHARFFFEGGHLKVEDMGSMNGVFLRLSGSRKLAFGDRFLLGRQLLCLDPPPFGEDRDPEDHDDRTVEEPSWLAVPASDGEGGDGNLTARYGFPAEKVVASLTALMSDGRPGNRYLLDGQEIVLGREHGDIVFTRDPYMSNEHAALRPVDGVYHLEDLGSRNGTFMAVRDPVVLGDDDELLIGRQLFKVRFE